MIEKTASMESTAGVAMIAEQICPSYWELLARQVYV